MKTEISEADKKLLKKADQTDDFMEISEMMDMAESQEVKDMLHNKAVRAYHIEEYMAYGEM